MSDRGRREGPGGRRGGGKGRHAGCTGVIVRGYEWVAACGVADPS